MTIFASIFGKKVIKSNISEFHHLLVILYFYQKLKFMYIQHKTFNKAAELSLVELNKELH